MKNDFKELFEKIQTNDKNREENQGVVFCDFLRKIHDIDKIDHKETTKIELKNTEKIETEIDIENEIDLYNFYKNNLLENNKIISKQKTADMVNLSRSTIVNYNNKLKEKKLLYTEGRNIYLNTENKSEEV